MTAQRTPDPVGSVAEEAGRLLESLRRAGADAAGSAGTRPTGAGPEVRTPHGPGEPWADEGDAAGADTRGPGPTDPAGRFTCDDPVCQWCPVCRASAFVRRLSPETLSGLAELAGFAATVLTDLASARARQEDGDGPPASGPEEDERG